MAEIEVRTKKGQIQRGDVVLTEEWQTFDARAVGGMLDSPNVEWRDIGDTSAQPSPLAERGPDTEEAPAPTDRADESEGIEAEEGMTAPRRSKKSG